jgi:hypothetical protein
LQRPEACRHLLALPCHISGAIEQSTEQQLLEPLKRRSQSHSKILQPIPAASPPRLNLSPHPCLSATVEDTPVERISKTADLSGTMPRQNVVIAIIVICLFVVLAIVGWGIYAIQNKVSIFAKKEEIPDEEE